MIVNSIEQAASGIAWCCRRTDDLYVVLGRDVHVQLRMLAQDVDVRALAQQLHLPHLLDATRCQRRL